MSRKVGALVHQKAWVSLEKERDAGIDGEME